MRVSWSIHAGAPILAAPNERPAGEIRATAVAGRDEMA
jgi:hypothetical protein